MNILVQSNAPWSHTGYGGPTKSLITRLDRAGHTVNVFAFYGIHGGAIKVGNITILPPGEDAWGHDIIDAHIATTGAELLITIMDAWVLHDYEKRGVPWLAWCPIDHQEAPPLVVNALRNCPLPISYTKHGEQALKAAGISRAMSIPLGVETRYYYPDTEGRARMRHHHDIPDDGFLIGMVANNRGFPIRKGFDVTFEAFAKLRQKYPKTYLYCHTNPNPGPDRPDLRAIMHALGLTDEDVIFPKGYDYQMGYKTDLMRDLYNAFDVLAVPSVGEGFLLPAVEAHACGKPVIASNCTSLPEVTCPDARYMLKKLEPKISLQGAHWFFPTPKELYKGLLWAREHKGDEVMARRAREFVLSHYDWDSIYVEHWAPLLERLENDLRAARQALEQKPPTGLAYEDGVEKPSEWALPVCP